MPPFPQPTFASSSLPGTPLPLWLQGELRVALRPFLSNRGYKYSTEQPVLNPVIKSCAPVSNGNRCLIFPLRERNECN
ncbi:recQ-mediated genome instability protein 1 isoform X4 [Ovis canadensis]|uniref:recQ-mediated genome instability protein 1 isoform X4 n=1 Tax=Ovis canadensis TaxID=37174 RepID=UPI00375271C0